MTELHGNKANEYADDHLVKTQGKNWLIFYKCPDTGVEWMMDWPQGYLQGGGTCRLRKLPLEEGHQRSAKSC